MVSRYRRGYYFYDGLVAVAVVVLWYLCGNSITAYMPEAEEFDAPSESIRGALKAAIKHDYEDVVVMQTEMAWGAHEMKRYKSIKGEWPVRTSLSGDERDDDDDEDSGDVSFLRGKEPPPDPADADTDYWNYLISIF